MQLTRQSVTRLCYVHAVNRRCACLLVGVVILLAICAYLRASSTEDMTHVEADTEIAHHSFDKDNGITEDRVEPDDDVASDTARAAFAEANQGIERQRSTVPHKKDANVDIEDDAAASGHIDVNRAELEVRVARRRSEKERETDKDGNKKDADVYDKGPGPAAEGNGEDATDRYHTHSNREADRDIAGEDDREIDESGRPNYDGGKEAGEDATDNEVGKDADGVNGNNDEVDRNKNKAGGNAVEHDSGKSYDTCDVECQKFREELASWPSTKPKAFIYYLIHRPAMRSLGKSIRALHQNFNRRFRYPIVVFVESDLDSVADRRRIGEMVPTDGESPPPPVYVQVVHFKIPDYVNTSLVPRMAGFGSRKRTIGYRHMCRFHAGGVYDQPIVRSPGLEYGWRLDDDSLIRRPINYDLFQVMRDGGYQYGYRQINKGWSPVDYALWDAVDQYLNSTPSLKPTFYRQWPKNAARYFNNFEVSALRVWMSAQYRDYFNFVDRLGGIYYYKWGDAAIKTIAVTLFIPRDRTHRFTGIAYSHT